MIVARNRLQNSQPKAVNFNRKIVEQQALYRWTAEMDREDNLLDICCKMVEDNR